MAIVIHNVFVNQIESEETSKTPATTCGIYIQKKKENKKQRDVSTLTKIHLLPIYLSIRTYTIVVTKSI